MPELAGFQKAQFAFTRHVRDPDHCGKPDDVEEQRMAVYRRLFYNNIEGFIARAFPVLRKILTDDQWHGMVRDFFSRYRCKSPYFLEISSQFLDYLENHRVPKADDFPFLLELAHYERVELEALVSAKEIDPDGIDEAGDLMTGKPVLSPLVWPLAYEYAVHRIGPAYLPDKPESGPTFLLVVRNREDAVDFMEINPFTWRLIEILTESPGIRGSQALRQLADESGAGETDALLRGGADILARLKARDVILGSR